MKVNYHTHSTWCDGQDDPEKIVLSAIEKGFGILGFSSHSDMLESPGDYRAAIRALAEKYRNRITVLTGLEAELALPFERLPGEYDYVIGSVHYLRAEDGAMVSVDHTPEIALRGIREHFGGDGEKYVRAYFAAIRATLDLDFEVIGHPDLVRKFNLKTPYFDETAAWYREELVRTADAIAASGKVVEVNTGAIARGWMDDVYPSAEFRELLKARGVGFILSSDAHSASTLDGAFERYGEYARVLDLKK